MSIRNALFVVADGGLWRIDENGSRRRLASDVEGPLVPWSTGPERTQFLARDEIWMGAAIPTKHVVLQSDGQVIQADLSTGAVRIVRKPAPDAGLLHVSESGSRAVFRRDAADGSSVVLAIRGGVDFPLDELNRHLREVVKAEQIRLTYQVAGGSELTSCLLLPTSREPEKRLALVVYSYPGHSGNCESTDLSRFDPYNYQLLTAHQYAVLFAATPRKLIRSAEGPSVKLPEILMAAVDSAIEQGYADPERMAVLGISQGYESTLQLIEHTNRFKAAIAMFGISNGSSHYGTTPLRYRLGFSPGDFALLGSSVSRYEGWGPDHGFGAKPWEDPARYIRNSPLFQAGRIETPLLLMNSDLDDFPLGQSEEIFNALHRQRKEAPLRDLLG